LLGAVREFLDGIVREARGHRMSHGSDDSDNYWPGYVDALTSMVQVLAFVMMMLAMAVFVLSQSVAKHAVEAIAKVVNAEVNPTDDVKKMTQAVMEKVRQLQSANSASEPRKPEKSVDSSASAAAASIDSEKLVGARVSNARSRQEPARIQVSPESPRLSLGFEERSFKVQQDAAQSIARLVDDNKVLERGQVIMITAYAYSGDGALSEARRLAYYRAMMARKQLVDSRVRPDSIRVNVNDTADREKGLTVEMIIADKSAN
jgi:hypothetical protein